VEAPQVVADLQPATEVQAAVPLTPTAVSLRGAALRHPCRQQQLTTVQFMDKPYNMMISKVKMKRPPHSLYFKTGGNN
jgi:hypothetical protein